MHCQQLCRVAKCQQRASRTLVALFRFKTQKRTVCQDCQYLLGWFFPPAPKLLTQWTNQSAALACCIGSNFECAPKPAGHMCCYGNHVSHVIWCAAPVYSRSRCSAADTGTVHYTTALLHYCTAGSGCLPDYTTHLFCGFPQQQHLT